MTLAARLARCCRAVLPGWGGRGGAWTAMPGGAAHGAALPAATAPGGSGHCYGSAAAVQAGGSDWDQLSQRLASSQGASTSSTSEDQQVSGPGQGGGSLRWQATPTLGRGWLRMQCTTRPACLIPHTHASSLLPHAA